MLTWKKSHKTCNKYIHILVIKNLFRKNFIKDKLLYYNFILNLLKIYIWIYLDFMMRILPEDKIITFSNLLQLFNILKK